MVTARVTFMLSATFSQLREVVPNSFAGRELAAARQCSLSAAAMESRVSAGCPSRRRSPG
jgi:hypothetical protein